LGRAWFTLTALDLPPAVLVPRPSLRFMVDTITREVV